MYIKLRPNAHRPIKRGNVITMPQQSLSQLTRINASRKKRPHRCEFYEIQAIDKKG